MYIVWKLWNLFGWLLSIGCFVSFLIYHYFANVGQHHYQSRVCHRKSNDFDLVILPGWGTHKHNKKQGHQGIVKLAKSRLRF